MKIVMIGTGNAATVLGKMFLQAGNEIVQVYGRNIIQADQLAKELNSKPCNGWDAISQQADFYIVAISDKALYELDQHLFLPGKVVLHTAGSVSREVLKNISSNYGVFYPLQSLRKEMPVLTGIPLLIDGANERTLEKSLHLAQQISGNVSFADDEKRLNLHIAAVCMNNFANHLYELAENFCSRQKVDFKLLQPIALETAKRIELISPHLVLTGPAIRNDQVTIERHLEILRSHPLFYTLYQQMTESIREFHKAE